ncbi:MULTISPECIES: hypothetical protein [unclassified Pseudonocardia]|uniref:hypothetical protein n=1 Tax=unclassified Pseudonocardia TaxID=2619320 RepID=UPI0001FFEEAD|nr:hypothetical protein [Pseudonocardia sp. Ae707_Ps1]OLM09225.1 hypothetical protein Ae707Ps1_6172c [Pseudonocardia sp. Ae707_Ps1]
MNTITRTLAGLVIGVSAVAGTVAGIVTPTAATADSVIAQAPTSRIAGAGSAVSVVPAERGVSAEAVAAAAQAVTAAEEARTAAATEQAREAEAAEQSPALTCEPHAAARLVGNLIVNKACPELNAAKEQAQREYTQQQPWSGNPGPPSEATQRQRIADGLAPVGGGYAPDSAEYNTCVRNPVASVCGG